MNILILQLRLKIADLMLQILRLQTGKISNPDKRLVLYDVARACIGKDMAPLENEYGCAEAVNAVFKKAFGREIGGGLSTFRMYPILRSDKTFQPVLSPLPGDIIISPTGYGNGNLSNGHVGIVGENETILSNTSVNGLWLSNFTISSWKEKYVYGGGFPMAYFRVVA